MTSARKRISVGLGALAVLVALAGAPFIGVQRLAAQGPGGPGGPHRFGGHGPGGPGMFGPMMFGQLDLSETQQDQIKQIVDSHRDEQRAVGDRARAAHHALEAAITADALNEAAVRTAAADVALVDADLAVGRARIYSQVFQMLTSDQQKQLKKQQAAMQERMQKMQSAREQRKR